MGTEHQPRERAVQCWLCPPGHTTWNHSGVCDKHQPLADQLAETHRQHNDNKKG